MTLKEFNRQALEILNEQFKPQHTHPLDLGIERNQFAERQLTRLIAMGRKVGFATAKRRVASWERKLVRAGDTRRRMESQKAGLYPSANVKPADAPSRNTRKATPQGARQQPQPRS